MDNSFSFNDLPTINPAFDNMTLKPGVEIDTYELLQKIGHGGMGEVWKARDLAGNRDVALKFVPRDIQNHEEEMLRVAETFQAVHRLHHEHICPMHALRRHPDFGAYLMMDFIDGIPLSLYLRHVRTLTLSRTLEILRPLASALDYAHSRKVIHRDIKPGNIMLVFEKNGDGTWNFEELRDVQLIDFGLASEFRQSMTRVSQVRMGTSGTMLYMSPEQFRGEYQDAHSDQYSLGTMAYEMLAGRLPFCADDPMILMNCISNIPPLPLSDQPETVNSALLRALAKPRTGRFSTCTEFVNALRGETLEEMEQKNSQTPRPAPISEPSDPFADILKTAEQKREEERKRAEKELAEKKKRLVDSARKAYADEDFPLAKKHVDELLALDPENPHYLQFRDFIQQQLDAIPPTLKAGDRKVWTADGIKYAFRWCPAGSFTMGSPSSEPGRYSNEGPQHKVTLTRGFWMLETEVTQGMWESVMGTTLEEQAQKMLHDDTEYKFSSGKKTIRDFYGFQRDEDPSKVLAGEGSDRPMYYVNWHESVEFCRKLSSKLGMEVSLPTEAQWEYACRAGSKTALPNGPIEILGRNNAPALDPIAWYVGNSMQEFTGTSRWNSSSWPETQYPGGLCGVHPVGKKDANAWGLCDMIGNVWEWCSDWYGSYVESPASDPTGPNSGSYRVFRGGGWYGDAEYCRSADRNYGLPGARSYYLGFRIVLADPAPGK